MAKIGYARVSTLDQDLTLQVEALKTAGCERIFSGKQSGKGEQNEKKLAEMLDYIRDSDIVYVAKLDRLGRSLKSILSTIDSIHNKGATLVALDGSIDTSNKSPFAQATISLMGTFAQLERDLIVSRTSEGREQAKRQGKHLGRYKQIDDKTRKLIRGRVAAGEKQTQLAKEFDVTRTTIHRIVAGN